MTLVLSFPVALGGFAFTIALAAQGMEGAFAGLLLAGCGIVVGLVANTMKGRPPTKARQQSPGRALGLLAQERRIRDRISEIEGRVQQLRQVVSAATEAEHRRAAAETKRIALAAAELMTSYRLRYSAQLWRLKILRWRNSLEPVSDGVGSGDGSTLEDRLNRIRQAEAAGRDISLELQQSEISRAPEAEGLRREVSEAQEGLGRLYDEALAHQTRLAIAGLSPAEEQLFAARVSHSAGAPGVLSVSSALTELVSEFQALETEFERLKAEHSLSDDG